MRVCLVVGGLLGTGCFEVAEHLYENQPLTLRLYETMDQPADGALVGVGLGLLVSPSVALDLGLPDGLEIVGDVGLAWNTDLAPMVVDDAGQPVTQLGATYISITPTVPGPNTLTFSSTDTKDTETMSYVAVAPELRYHRRREPETLPLELNAFAGYHLPLAVEWHSAGRPLLGRVPFTHDVPQERDVSGTYYFAVGTVGSVMTFAPVGITGPRLTVHAVDTSAVASLELLAPDTSPIAAVLGTSTSFTIRPRDAAGQRIVGGGPLAATAVQGTAVELSSITTFGDGQVSLLPAEVGQATVTFTCGTATIDVTIVVTAAP